MMIPPLQQILLPIINTVSQRDMEVTSFIDSDVDKTNHFSGYDFTFISSNGN